MAQKKSFKDNPALQFFGGAAESVDRVEKKDDEMQQESILAQPEPTSEVVNALPEQLPLEAAAPVKSNPLFIETKSKRVALLMQPSLHAKLKERANEEGVSLNELVHSILSDTLSS